MEPEVHILKLRFVENCTLRDPGAQPGLEAPSSVYGLEAFPRIPYPLRLESAGLGGPFQALASQSRGTLIPGARLKFGAQGRGNSPET